MILTVFSPKGGTGKSNTTAIMAGFLADQGFKTLMVDADSQQTLPSHYPVIAADYELNRIITEVSIADVFSRTDTCWQWAAI